MPKIEVYEKSLHRFCGFSVNHQELEGRLQAAKAELDDIDPAQGILKIELNDTNRPDLWSTAGLGRQLRIHSGGEIPEYDFFSSVNEAKDSAHRRIDVDPALENIRPYVAAFAFTGKPIDEPMLKDLIQTQEKLCWNYGQKRRSIAMGVYRSDLMEYPVRYRAADPDKTRFKPLQAEKVMNLHEILDQHPKGRDFGFIVKKYALYPFLDDSKGEVLSFPPIINSDNLGAVQVGDNNLFVEMTGTDIKSLVLALSIVACDLADGGYEILPVKTVYPYDTELGREVVCPYYFQTPLSVDIDVVKKVLGENLVVDEAARHCRSMGLSTEVSGFSLQVRVPEYRNDFMHPVDIVEDIMIGRGTNNFEPVMPSQFTAGRITSESEYGRAIKETMIGLGYQEMIYNYLGSRRDLIERMHILDSVLLEVANPMSESFGYVRNSTIPSLLASEAVSAHAVYPHAIFEVGKVAFRDSDDNQGCVTRNHLGFLYADREADYNQVMSHVSAVFYYLNREFSLRECDDPRLVPGRRADILCDGGYVGVVGEIHPEILEEWGIQMPSAACELDLDLLMGG